MQTIYDYFFYYQKFALSAWHNITPMQYGYLLVTVAAIGWLLMKSGAR